MHIHGGHCNHGRFTEAKRYDMSPFAWQIYSNVVNNHDRLKYMFTQLIAEKEREEVCSHQLIPRESTESCTHRLFVLQDWSCKCVWCKDWVYNVIVDKYFCKNIVSQDVINKLPLRVEIHPSPYLIMWANNTKILANQRCLVSIRFGRCTAFAVMYFPLIQLTYRRMNHDLGLFVFHGRE